MDLMNVLTGKSPDHLVPFKNGPFLIHREAASALLALFNRAKSDGFDLAMTSSYRSYEAQKNIWNNKVQGLRPVLDSDSRPVDITTKSQLELMYLILRWSAIPGGSRHHWGTDLDVYDQNAIGPDYKIQLVPDEYESGGVFAQSNFWLTENMGDFGFFRPYSVDRGGIAPEPWHISYRPLSEYFLQQFNFNQFIEHLEGADFLLKEEAADNAQDIYMRFIQIADE